MAPCFIPHWRLSQKDGLSYGRKKENKIILCKEFGPLVGFSSACYLGFKEIILLGVDHSFVREKRKDGTIEIHSGIKNHFTDYQSDSFWGNGLNDEGYVVFPLDFATMAFEKAREYADGHGIKIYNATRGGKLEVFERVNFDKLFQEEKNKMCTLWKRLWL